MLQLLRTEIGTRLVLRRSGLRLHETGVRWEQSGKTGSVRAANKSINISEFCCLTLKYQEPFGGARPNAPRC